MKRVSYLASKNQIQFGVPRHYRPKCLERQSWRMDPLQEGTADVSRTIYVGNLEYSVQKVGRFRHTHRFYILIAKFVGTNRKKFIHFYQNSDK